MFKELWTKLRNFFEQPPISNTKDIRKTIVTEYDVIVQDIRNATSLAQLLEARSNIRTLHQYLIEHREEFRGRKLIINLNVIWKARYEYWKSKTRGHWC